MAFGQQPQGNNAQNNGFNNQYQYNQQYNQYNAQPQYAYAPNGTAAVNVQATYSYEQAERSSVNSAYTHMTLGLIVTAVVAIITQMSGAYLALIKPRASSASSPPPSLKSCLPSTLARASIQ